MGKILNALKTANGDIPDLVMRCLDDSGAAPEVRPVNHRRASATAVVEPIFEMPAAEPPSLQDEAIEEPWAAVTEPEAIPGMPARWISLRVSDAAPLLSPSGDAQRAAEQYRIVRTKIFHQVQTSSVTVVSSPGVGDGKTVTAVNLSAALALKSDDKVILVDADLRLSRVHERLGMPKSPGLAEVLARRCALEDAVLRVEELPNFYILPAGQPPGNPTELLDSANWRDLVARMRDEFRRTIIDSPPIEAVADYDLIAASCDSVLLVVRPDHTQRRLLTSALAKTKGRLTGVLINDARDWFLWKHASPSYHYYQNGSRSAK